ncbi:MAG: ATP-binding cassette domain-containing protein [Verrucomicrobiae bacterium]|nr:ATP-binding cassette domain-containing protein [Verrucomicrobiae bacterium]
MSAPPSSAKEVLCELRRADIASPRAPSVALLQQVDWAITSGERWLILSPPGAGKSALLQTAAGIQRPLQGEVWLFGQCLHHLREPELLPLRQKVGLVFEGGGRLFPELTVAQNVALPQAYHHSKPWAEAIAQITPLLDWLELGPYASEAPVRLPRAWLPRAGLARALALQPRLLFLDHPWRGADPQERQWWQSKLSALPSHVPSVAALVLAVDEPEPWLSGCSRLAVVHQRQLATFPSAAEGHAWLAAHHLLASPP